MTGEEEGGWRGGQSTKLNSNKKQSFGKESQ